jgi:hypothetical protein
MLRRVLSVAICAYSRRSWPEDFEDWLKHTQDIPGALYLWIIEHLFRDNELVSGSLEIGGRRVTLANATERAGGIGRSHHTPRPGVRDRRPRLDGTGAGAHGRDPRRSSGAVHAAPGAPEALAGVTGRGAAALEGPQAAVWGAPRYISWPPLTSNTAPVMNDE